ncbi:MAG: hypothetical protein U1D30_15030 [Planctomycetota bacterium]
MHFTSSGISRVEMGARDAAFAFCKRAKLKQKSLDLLRPGQTPWEFFEELREREHYADAIRVLAHRLGKREAIWWGALCMMHEWGEEMPPEAAAVLEAVVAWLLDPSDERRRRAGKLGKAARLKTAGCLGMAVFSRWRKHFSAGDCRRFLPNRMSPPRAWRRPLSFWRPGIPNTFEGKPADSSFSN